MYMFFFFCCFVFISNTCVLKKGVFFFSSFNGNAVWNIFSFFFFVCLFVLNFKIRTFVYTHARILFAKCFSVIFYSMTWRILTCTSTYPLLSPPPCKKRSISHKISTSTIFAMSQTANRDLVNRTAPFFFCSLQKKSLKK